MKNKFLLSFVLILSIVIFSCCKKDVIIEDPAPAGNLVINFEHFLDDQIVVPDTYMYINAAGNVYSFYLVRYFISDVNLYKNGVARKIKDWTDYFYIDTDIPSTFKWNVYDDLTPGDYDSISFQFGFKDEDNQSYMFVNNPEKNMVWPDELGGGYHYMQLEGKWIDPNDIKIGYAFHMGRGQTYNANNEPVAPFFDNSFRVSLPNSSFTINDGKTTEITIRMNIEKWFKEPHIYDHNQWGGDIMQQQQAMNMAKENGWNVFSFHN